MGDYHHGAGEEVKYVAHHGHENHNTGDEWDRYYEDGINHEAEHSYSYESGQQQEAGYGHRRVHSASGGTHTGFFLEDDETSSEKRGKPKSPQFGHLHEPSYLDTHSDPGCGDDGYDEVPDHARSQSISRVSSWLRDPSVGESNSQPAARAPPARLPPPRRHPPAADMVSRSVSLPNHCDEDEENLELGVCDPPAPRGNSIYRIEEKPLDKVFRFAKIGAGRVASVSRIGAGRVANASRTAAVTVKHRSIEFKNLAVPVVKPILDAVIEESRDQLMGPDTGRDRANPPQRLNSAEELDRMATPYVPSPMARPMARPMMRPGMAPGPRPVMRPGNAPGPRPVMRPGMAPGPRPVMRSGMAPGLRPPMRPGMRPPYAVPPMAVSGAGGQARPVGPTSYGMQVT